MHDACIVVAAVGKKSMEQQTTKPVVLSEFWLAESISQLVRKFS